MLRRESTLTLKIGCAAARILYTHLGLAALSFGTVSAALAAQHNPVQTIDVVLTSDKPVYTDGQPIRARLSNGLKVQIAGPGEPRACSIADLERLVDGTWVRWTNCDGRRVGLQSLNAGVHAVVFNRLAASDGSRSRIANFAAMEDDSVPLGNWGGAGISLTVTESGAHIEFDCSLATISESLRLNADGEFEVEGIYVFEPGGPRTQNSPQPKQYPAEFQGWTDRRQMDLTVTVTLLESVRRYGPFSLELGSRAELDKCG